MIDLTETTFDILIFAERLKQLMDDSNENTYTLAEAVFLTPGTISKYINAKMEPKRNTIELLAKHFRVNPGWLMGYDVDKWLDGQAPKTKTIPFFKTTNYNNGKPDDYTAVPIEDDVDLCLVVQDESMINARIHIGDYAYIRKQAWVEDGEVAAVVMDGVITLKRLYLLDKAVMLHSENPNIPHKVFSNKDKKGFYIIGKAVFVKFQVR